MHTIQHRDPVDLRDHPATKHLHILADDDPRFLALCRSIEDHGFAGDKPLTITADNRILDGRHRHRAARRMQLKTVPCVVVGEEHAATIILDSIANRKHFSKSAIAFECYPMFKAAHQEAVARAMENLRKGQQIPVRDGITDGNSIPEIAARIGISQDLMKFAKRVHDLFENHPDYAAVMVPKLYGEFQGGEHESTRPVGLGAILAGYATWKEGDKSKFSSAKHDQLELFTRKLGGFDAITPEEEKAFWKQFDARLDDWTAEGLSRELTKVEAARKFLAAMDERLRRQLKRKGGAQ